MICNRSKTQEGFSVVELLVSAAIFSVIALTVTGIFIRALEVERMAFAAQSVQDNIISVFGTMTKEVRVGTVLDANSNCTSNTLSVDVPDPSGSVYTVVYRLNTSTGIVEREARGSTAYVSSSDVKFNSLLFCIANAGLDDMPTRVTVLANVSSRFGKSVTMKVQTTLTLRDLTMELLN